VIKMKETKQAYFRDMIEPYVLLEPDKRRPSPTYLVNKLRRAVYEWREKGILLVKGKGRSTHYIIE